MKSKTGSVVPKKIHTLVELSLPSISMYHDHLVSKGLVPQSATGGLYCCYFLKNFLFGGRMPFEILQSLITPKLWHGHPLAAIRRGIAVLGSARCCILGRTVIDELTTLRDLYFDDGDLLGTTLTKLYNLPSTDRQQENRKRQRDYYDDDSGSNDRKKPTRTNAGSSNCEIAKNSRNIQTAHDARHPYEQTEWVMGPSATGNDAIHRFAPIMRSVDVVKLLS